jgi:hypothetical protein
MSISDSNPSNNELSLTSPIFIVPPRKVCCFRLMLNVSCTGVLSNVSISRV